MDVLKGLKSSDKSEVLTWNWNEIKWNGTILILKQTRANVTLCPSLLRRSSVRTIPNVTNGRLETGPRYKIEHMHISALSDPMMSDGLKVALQLHMEIKCS